MPVGTERGASPALRALGHFPGAPLSVSPSASPYSLLRERYFLLLMPVGTESGASPALRTLGHFPGAPLSVSPFGFAVLPPSRKVLFASYARRHRERCLPRFAGFGVFSGGPALRQSVRLRRTPSFEKGTFKFFPAASVLLANGAGETMNTMNTVNAAPAVFGAGCMLPGRMLTHFCDSGRAGDQNYPKRRESTAGGRTSASTTRHLSLRSLVAAARKGRFAVVYGPETKTTPSTAEAPPALGMTAGPPPGLRAKR